MRVVGGERPEQQNSIVTERRWGMSGCRPRAGVYNGGRCFHARSAARARVKCRNKAEEEMVKCSVCACVRQGRASGSSAA